MRRAGFRVLQLPVCVCSCEGLVLFDSAFLITPHSPSTVGATTTEECLSFIAECINRAHKAAKTVITVLENMVRSRSKKSAQYVNYWDRQEQETSLAPSFPTWLGKFSKVGDKKRVGVCLGTCRSIFLVAIPRKQIDFLYRSYICVQNELIS